MPDFTLDLRQVPALTRKTLIITILTLSLFHLASVTLIHGYGISSEFAPVSLFHLDQEQNIPTFFSVLLLLFCAAAILAHGTSRDGPRLRFDPLTVLVALLFALIALDEFASIHERVAGTINAKLGAQATLPHIWLVPYALLALPAGDALLTWLARIEPQLRRWLILSLGVAVAGGVGLEAVAAALHLLTPAATDGALWEIALFTLEEILEMTGFAAFGVLLWGKVGGV